LQFTTMGRSGLLPYGLARMSKRCVPIWSIVTSGVLAAILALFLGIETLTSFTSMGTLVAFTFVCIGQLWRRYNVVGETPRHHSIIMAVIIAIMIPCGMLVGFVSNYLPNAIAGWAVPLAVFMALIPAFYAFPQRYQPTGGFVVPFMPWVPCCGICINMFLVGTLSYFTFIFWGCAMVVAVLLSLCYGLHKSQGEGRARKALARMP
jgi:hypothetical protein